MLTFRDIGWFGIDKNCIITFKSFLTASSSLYPSSLGFASFLRNFPFFAALIPIETANRQIKAPNYKVMSK